MKVRVNKRAVYIVFTLIGVAILSAVLFFLISGWKTSTGKVSSESSQYSDEDTISYRGESYVLRKDIETILLIGLDQNETDTETEGYNNAQQADFLMLILLDRQNNTYTALHLNRDTMTDITMLGVRGEKSGTFTGQLALAHTYGSGGRDSCRNTTKAVSNLLYGIDINHYIALTMDAVPRINDLCGGVQVEMLEDFSSIDPEMSEGAVVTLQGEQALTYVRTRKGLDDSTNLSRMERQRQYLSALGLKIQSCMEQDDTFAWNAVTEISKYMESDCTAEQISRLADKIETYQNFGIVTEDGKAVKGEDYMEFYADEDSLKAFVIDNFYEPDTKISQP